MSNRKTRAWLYNYRPYKRTEDAKLPGWACGHQHKSVQDAANCATNNDDRDVYRFTFGVVKFAIETVLCERMDNGEEFVVTGKERAQYYELRGMEDPDVADKAEKAWRARMKKNAKSKNN